MVSHTSVEHHIRTGLLIGVTSGRVRASDDGDDVTATMGQVAHARDDSRQTSGPATPQPHTHTAAENSNTRNVSKKGWEDREECNRVDGHTLCASLCHGVPRHLPDSHGMRNRYTHSFFLPSPPRSTPNAAHASGGTGRALGGPPASVVSSSRHASIRRETRAPCRGTAVRARASPRRGD
jgi:hypothetical protein